MLVADMAKYSSHDEHWDKGIYLFPAFFEGGELFVLCYEEDDESGEVKVRRSTDVNLELRNVMTEELATLELVGYLRKFLSWGDTLELDDLFAAQYGYVDNVEDKLDSGTNGHIAVHVYVPGLLLSAIDNYLERVRRD